MVSSHWQQKMNEAFLWLLKTAGTRVLCHHNIESEFEPFGHEGVCCLVSQLIRVNILIDCLLFKLILEFIQISKALWNFHIESFYIFADTI